MAGAFEIAASRVLDPLVKRIVSSTVRAEGEDTPQRFKVLEAFIMSTIDSELSRRIEEADISTDFQGVPNGLDTVLSQPTAPDPSAHVRLSIPDYILPDTLRPQDAIVSEDAPSIGFCVEECV